MTDRNHRARCRRCKGTGSVCHSYAHGVCFDCGGKGYAPSINERVATLARRLENIATIGAEFVAKGYAPAVIEGYRADYRRVRAELRSLGG
tara:strand:+ start:455 stop:727 length:273 start_codon:yes stop_codon:yes gene_type:complete